MGPALPVRFALFILMAISCFDAVLAQEAEKSDRERPFRYASVLLGGGFNDDSDRAMGESVSFQHGWMIFSLRSIAIEHSYDGGRHAYLPQVPYRTFDVGLMAGHSTRRSTSTLYVSALAGLAATNVAYVGTEPAMPADERKLALGLPVELRVGWAATSNFGVSVTAFANYNSLDPFFGLMLQAQAGF